MVSQTAKCKCQHCSQNIEFDFEHAGETVPCPHCGTDTILFVPPTTKPPPIPTREEKPIPVAKLAAVPASEAIAGRISRSRLIIFTSLFFGLSVLAFLLCCFVSNHITSEEEAQKQKRSLAARAYTDYEAKLKAAETARSADEYDLMHKSAAAGAEMIESDAQLKQLRNERIELSNFIFWAAIALGVFWLPGVIYLFLVPASVKTRTIAPLCS